jgi:hypothetical protein
MINNMNLMRMKKERIIAREMDEEEYSSFLHDENTRNSEVTE